MAVDRAVTRNNIRDDVRALAGKYNATLPTHVLIELADLVEKKLNRHQREVFVDLDSGTILNGPVVAVRVPFLSEELTDEDVRDIARQVGRQVG